MSVVFILLQVAVQGIVTILAICFLNKGLMFRWNGDIQVLPLWPIFIYGGFVSLCSFGSLAKRGVGQSSVTAISCRLIIIDVFIVRLRRYGVYYVEIFRLPEVMAYSSDKSSQKSNNR